jgi:chromosome partitioning protein
MPVVAVVNRKGGSGKSTLAAHLAAYCAHNGMPVMLGDVDKQQSTQAWLKLRSTQVTPNRSPLVGWTVDPKSVLRAPTGVSHVVLDTPGGLRGFDLARVAMFADAILMPVCNSVFDRESAAACYAEMMTLPRIASGRCVVAAIGMRLDARTKAGEVLHAWAEQQKLPFLGVLRETQNYVRCIERGLTLFDLPPAKVQDDLDQWRPIIEWLQPVLRPAPRTEAPTVTAAPVPAPDGARFESLRPAQVSLSLNRDQTLEQLDKVAAAAAPRAGVMNRVGSLLGSLSVPRFLQR